ncbi:hypothetical protein [Legionella micdadei]|uniref:ATP-grasp domain-containing protein n=1 Tax=Legionella micdadei TaxID=451 RepID=A0A098GE71_LEGMI|nr:hypothetical protein [Legionella micdadei]ARG98072.1 hypothetical protein B6N58_10600 [Legionella micdadei]KTD30097.1 hypothetical protein Lmic_0278 [Legionella micdadei]NSL18528.1 hypothetical protein [Legionella micdadei]CEG60292.1 protein of unknown function [Legionella micdadei]SCY56936.1 hypothetical protein SAMN02982997_02089 [Legionella micdadei]
MPTEISYHIADFKVDDEIKILELGNAFYGSNLSERAQHGVDNKAAMLKHAAQFGPIELIFPELRSFRHSRIRWETSDWELPQYLRTMPIPTNPKQIHFVDDCFMEPVMECIQEKHDAYLEQGKNSQLVFDGAIDTFYLCDRNKRIFNTLLDLNGLKPIQPETWFYQLDSAEPFIPPSNIPFFIVKPMQESLGKGVMLVANKELPALLEALKTGANYAKDVGDIDYYARSKNRGILIQQFCPGKLIQHNGKLFRPTARAVFAVVREGNQTYIDILDIFWKLPKTAVQSETPIPEQSVSYSGNSNQVISQISVEKSTYQAIESALREKLMALSTAIYNYDIKSYLFKLDEKKQHDEIRYYLDNYGHVRVRRLDQEFVKLILAIDENKAKRFLVEQAKHFALPWHLEFKNLFLKKWIQDNLAELDPELLMNLREFFSKSKEALAGSGRADEEEVLKEYTSFIEQIDALLALKEKKQEAQAPSFKQSSTQTFFKDGKAELSDKTLTLDVTYS